MSQSSLSADLAADFAHRLADESAAIVAPLFRQPIAVEDHNAGTPRDFDPVTRADRDAEQRMFELVHREWPDHAFLGEEFGRRGASEARYTWVVDPIDGTKAFISGTPLWGTLIALLDGRVPLVGLMDQPFTGERFWAADGSSRLSGRAVGEPLLIKTRSCDSLAIASLATTHPDYFDDTERDAFSRLTSRVRMTRYGGDCYSYCLVAAGFIDLVVEAGLRSHDIAALIPIIDGAGGVITTWDGRSAVDGGRIIAAGDRRLHAAAMEVLNA